VRALSEFFERRQHFRVVQFKWRCVDMSAGLALGVEQVEEKPLQFAAEKITHIVRAARRRIHEVLELLLRFRQLAHCPLRRDNATIEIG
jgi:hypothetical protein